jgi:8-oxo-dGTP diphosphatase
MLNVVCALIISKGRILSCQLGIQSDHPLKWEFPGGKVNTGEAPGKAIVREIKEELGVEISVISQLDPGYYDYGFRQINLFPFVCKLKGGILHLHEHIKFGWFTVEELNNLDLVEADRQLIGNSWNKQKLLEYMRENMESRG